MDDDANVLIAFLENLATASCDYAIRPEIRDEMCERVRRLANIIPHLDKTVPPVYIM